MEEIIKAIKEKVQDGNRMPCSVALKIAEDFKVSPARVGEELNNLDIKIVGCQLGCFK